MILSKETILNKTLNKILNKSTVSFVLIQFIVFAFAVKYSSRFTDYYLLVGLSAVILQTIIWTKQNYIKKIASKFSINLIFVDILLLLLLIFFSTNIFARIPIEGLNVDRWSVIIAFWDTFFAGGYAYAAKSHMGNPPGPMPFYFLIALPFYLLNLIDYLSLLGIFIFYSIMLHQKFEPQHRTAALLLILSSTFYMWEICTRSNLFLNSSLILLGMVLFVGVKNYSKFSNQLIIGILLGLFLSTRNVFAMCYIVLFMYFLKSKQISLGAIFKISVIIFLVFVFTFFPFVINFQADFLANNPFTIQSNVLIPSYLTLAIVFFSSFLFLFCRNNIDIFFYSGTILFVTICIHFIYHIILDSFWVAFFGSKADISYFIFCIPFFYYFLLCSKKQPQ